MSRMTTWQSICVVVRPQASFSDTHLVTQVFAPLGDLFGVKNNGVLRQYGFLRFSQYGRIIPENVTSIGIFCQSLNPDCSKWTTRQRDCDYVGKCTTIINRLADYLKKR